MKRLLLILFASLFLCSQVFAAGDIIDRGASSTETTAQARDDVWLSPASILYIEPTFYTSQYSDNLAAVLSTIGSANATLVIDSAESLSANATFPATLSVSILKPGCIDIDSSVELTINGPFEAGLYQVFSGNGSVGFGSGSVEYARPEWKGAKADNSVDCTSALNAVFNWGVPVKGSTGIYKTTDLITVTTDNFCLYGSGKYQTIIFNTGINGAIKFQCNYIQLKDLEVRGNEEHSEGSSGSGLIFDHSSPGYMGKSIDIQSCRINSHGEHGVKWAGNAGDYSSYINFLNTEIAGNHSDAVNCEGDKCINAISFSGCKINGRSASYVTNGSDGIVIQKGQTLNLDSGTSLQSFVNCVRYGEAATSYGFISQGVYYEGFTEAGIRLGTSGDPFAVGGIDIHGNYFNLSSITNTVQGAGVRIHAGQGVIGANSYSNASATKKCIFIDSVYPSKITVPQIYEGDIPYCTLASVEVGYTEKEQAMSLCSNNTNWNVYRQRSSNLYGAGDTYNFYIPAKYLDWMETVRVKFWTDNTDATIDVKVYEIAVDTGGSPTQIGTGNATGTANVVVSVQKRAQKKYGYSVVVTIVDDGVGGASTYIYGPLVIGNFS